MQTNANAGTESPAETGVEVSAHLGAEAGCVNKSRRGSSRTLLERSQKKKHILTADQLPILCLPPPKFALWRLVVFSSS